MIIYFILFDFIFLNLIDFVVKYWQKGHCAIRAHQLFLSLFLSFFSSRCAIGSLWRRLCPLMLRRTGSCWRLRSRRNPHWCSSKSGLEIASFRFLTLHTWLVVPHVALSLLSCSTMMEDLRSRLPLRRGCLSWILSPLLLSRGDFGMCSARCSSIQRSQRLDKKLLSPPSLGLILFFSLL